VDWHPGARQLALRRRVIERLSVEAHKQGLPQKLGRSLERHSERLVFDDRRGLSGCGKTGRGLPEPMRGEQSRLGLMEEGPGFQISTSQGAWDKAL
jgi:hypothetical protein